MTLTELFAAIAAAIRSKDGTTASIPATTFPERIMAISGGGGGSGGPIIKVAVKNGPNSDPIGGKQTEFAPIKIDILKPTVSATSIVTPWYVQSVSGASYGFSINSDGYYESKNKGKASSYAMCQIMFQFATERTITLDCINYAQSNYDYGIISEVDTMLSMDNSADSSGVLKSFKGQSSANVVSVPVTVPAGKHYICVKFIKNASTNSNNDTLQFKVNV